MTIQTLESGNGWKTPSEGISRKHLVNILNYVNFRGAYVVVNLKSLVDGRRLSLRAAPEPCAGDTARLAWSETPPGNIDAAAHQLVDFFIDMGSRVVIAGGRATDVSRSGIRVLLPERCYATSRRQMERFSSALVHVTLSRNGSEETGLLRDFGGGCLRVRFAVRDSFLLNKRNKLPIRVAITHGKTTVYNGEGVIKRRAANGENIDLVVALTALSDDKSFGGQVATLSRDLVASCRHPLSDRIIRLRLVKASYNSFVVSESPERAMLFPGLIIPEIRIDFGAGDSAQCMAKVVCGEGDAWLMSIIDMPIFDQRKLFSFLEKERGMRSEISPSIDPEDILRFFFEAGFIYPEKYAGVAESRGRLKEMLSRLYIDAPSICQHFVQDNNGLVEAHISMVRFYERSWIIHHHAALRGNGAGSAVLAQIFRYINSYSSFPSTRMDYLMSYYRRENRFPNRVFGGFARYLDTPRLCSIDPFAYLHHIFDPDYKDKCGSAEWRLDPTNRKDLLELAGFYARVSGGLALKAFGLEAGRREKTDDVESEFKKAGLRRQQRLFSLKREGKVKAVMLALDSDAGLNMSNLMKCIHVFVIDAKDLPFDLLTGHLNKLSSLYEEQKIPILFFPWSYVGDQRVLMEKVYNLLIFHASVGKRFAEFTERLTNRTMRRKYGLLTSDREREASEQW
jgi:hypothetical protein